MLAERVKEWTQEWKEEGLQQGIQQGARKLSLDQNQPVFKQTYGAHPKDRARLHSERYGRKTVQETILIAEANISNSFLYLIK